MSFRPILTALFLVLAYAPLGALEEGAAASFVSRISLDPSTGTLAVTVQYSGQGSARVSLKELSQAANTYTYRLVPITDGVRGSGVITGAHGKQRPALVAGQTGAEPEESASIMLSGPMLVGHAFPIWETGIWSGFPKRFEQSPSWEVRASLVIRRLDRIGQPDEYNSSECVTGFILDKTMWDELVRIRTRDGAGK